MDDLFSFDLSQYVAWYKTWDRRFLLDNVETAATFFIWMKLKSHSNYDGDLFHQHVQAIDAWILYQIRWIVPSSPLTIPTSISFLPFPKLDGRTDRDRVLTGSDMLITIAELRPSEVDTHHPHTQLFFHSNMSGSPAFYLLLREFMAQPTRCNERYRLDGEKCARLARNLWISVLPYEVRKTIEDPKFGRRYSAETTVHNTTHALGTSMFTEQISGDSEPAMILLPKILPKVAEASVDTLDEFLQVVQDHPLLKYADPAEKMYDLYQAAAAASEKLLGPELFTGLGERRALREAEALRLAAVAAETAAIVELRQESPSTDAQQTHFNIPQSVPLEKSPTFRARFGQFLSDWLLST